jgi:hypothetical protein
MPGFDGRGPQGRGAMSGRGLGRCSAAPSPATQDTTGDQSSPMENPTQPVVYGLGRGGVPRGCGRGNGRVRYQNAHNQQMQQR